MKTILLTLALLASPAFASEVYPLDGASDFAQNLGDRMNEIFSGKGGDSTKYGPLCALMRANVGPSYAAGVWLGDYANTTTDQAGVKMFVHEIPSILLQILLPKTGGLDGLSVDVADSSQGDGGNYSVNVSVHTASGKTLNGAAVISTASGRFKLIDAKYFGISGVQFMAGDFHKRLQAAAAKNPQHPVTQMVQDYLSEGGSIHCP